MKSKIILEQGEMKMSHNKRDFLTQYILSLKERTRLEKNIPKYGFDWIIYQLQLQKGETPVRLPFFRGESIEKTKTKPYEPEFGVDLSFLSEDKKILKIFVLKDEELTYKNWINHNFSDDLKRAVCPNLDGYDVDKVIIILAYNKDEDLGGVKSFDDFRKSQNSKIYDKVSLTFERWNLSKIVDEVEIHLFTPELMPQNLSGTMSYLCSQIADFDYMSNEWINQLIPNWKRFLQTLFKDSIDEIRINQVAVSLIILYEFEKESCDKEVAWLDLIEWAALQLWSNYKSKNNDKLNDLILNFWVSFYLGTLERYLDQNKLLFKVEHGIKSDKRKISHLSSINDAMLSYDFLSKFGLLTLGLNDFIPDDKREVFMKNKAMELKSFILLNPSTLRPLLDIHHIQLFMIWLIYYKNDLISNILDFFKQLENFLMIRRIGNVDIPFIEGRNNLKMVVEYFVTRKKPYEFIEDASYLLMMILEILVGMRNDETIKLAKLYFKHLVIGYGDDNKLLTKEEKPIDLQSWDPPDNWGKDIFLKRITDGTSISSANFFLKPDNLDLLEEKVNIFIKEIFEKFPNEVHFDLPIAVYLLACIKNESPLPPIFWRKILYNDLIIQKEHE